MRRDPTIIEGDDGRSAAPTRSILPRLRPCLPPVLTRLRPRLPPVPTALPFAGGSWMLHGLIAPVELAALLGHLRNIPPPVYLGAFAATGLAYVVFVGFDRAALGHLRLSVRPRATALGAALGYAVGNTGARTSGGAARWRVYGREGLDGWQVAAVSTFTILAHGIGATNVGLAALAIDPTALASIATLAPAQVRGAAVAALIVGCGALAAAAARKRPLAIGRFALRPLPIGMLGRFLALTLAEISLAAGLLHLLLPAGAISWPDLIVIYAAATLAGVLSHVPGGIGVFAGLVIAAMPASAPVAVALTALPMFRLIYLIVPFLLAIAVRPFVGGRMASGDTDGAHCSTVIPATGTGGVAVPSWLAWGTTTVALHLRRWGVTITKTKLGAAALLSFGLLGGAAVAQSMGGNGSDDAMELQALMATKMTLADAISAAEASGQGRAMSAEFDNGEDGEMPRFDVELVAPDGSISKMVVSAADGPVTPYDDAGEDDDNG